MILFHVYRKLDDRYAHFVGLARNREEIKRQAHPALLGDPENYIVSPLTIEGDSVVIGAIPVGEPVWR